VSRVAQLAGLFVDASQREIKVLLGLCVTQLEQLQETSYFGLTS
jgi:hypothetical protein